MKRDTARMSDQFPVGSLWVLPDGRRVRVTRNPHWLTDHTVSLYVENRRRGGRRTTEFRASSFAKLAKPYEQAHSPSSLGGEMTIMPAAGLTTRPEPTFKESDADAEMRRRFRDALNIIAGAERAARELPLPDFFEHPHCHCAPTDEMLGKVERPLQVVEPGYQRWSNVDSVSNDEEERSIHVYADGWDDMSEEGAFSYLECCVERGGCGTTWALPDEIEWG